MVRAMTNKLSLPKSVANGGSRDLVYLEPLFYKELTFRAVHVENTLLSNKRTMYAETTTMQRGRRGQIRRENSGMSVRLL